MSSVDAQWIVGTFLLVLLLTVWAMKDQRR